MKRKKVVTFKEVRKLHWLNKMPLLLLVWEGTGVETEKFQIQPRTPGSLPANGAAKRPSPVCPDTGPVLRLPPGPDLWGSSRAQPEAPLSSQSDRLFPRRPAPRPAAGTRRSSRPLPAASGRGFRPPAPPPAEAPLGVTDWPEQRWPTHRVARSFPPRPLPRPSFQPLGSPSPAAAAGYRPQPRGESGGQDRAGGRGARGGGQRQGGECPGEARPGAGGRRGPGAAGSETSPRASRGPRPGPPPPARRGSPNFQSHIARSPALLPPPYGNLQSQKVTRRRFLSLCARPPPPGQRSCRGDSGRGSGFLGQNLLGRLGRAKGEGESGSRCPDFFFFFQQKESTRFFPSSKSWQARGTEAQQRQPQNGGRPPPSARARGVPRQAHGAPALWGQVFPGNPGAPVALRDRNALWRTRCPAGAFQRAGPGGRGAGSGAPLVSGSGTPYLPSG